MKKGFKFITTVLVMSLSLLVGTFVSTASAATVPTASTTVPMASDTTGLPITDNNPVTVQINGSVGVFSITVSDANMRFINVSSGTAVRTQLVPVTTAYQSFISFDSVNYRPNSMIAWHFIPGAEYTLYVYPQTSPANVTISMSTSGSNLSWVYSNTTTSFTEKNILSGGQTETYGLAFQTPGTYKITVTTGISQLSATFSDALNPSQSEVKPSNGVYSSTYTFTKTISATGYAQNDYGLTLYSHDNPNTGAYYTVTVQKI